MLIDYIKIECIEDIGINYVDMYKLIGIEVY